MRIQDYHRMDNLMSVLDLSTPIELFKETHSEEEYRELMSFYKSEEWQQVERDCLNSDRRYYEGRKVVKLPTDTRLISRKRKYYEPQPFQLRIEGDLCEHFEEVFECPPLQQCIKGLPKKQYIVMEMLSKDCTYDEIADRVGTTKNNVSKLKNRALKTLRANYAEAVPA